MVTQMERVETTRSRDVTMRDAVYRAYAAMTETTCTITIFSTGIKCVSLLIS
jgi:hypothetical protein